MKFELEHNTQEAVQFVLLAAAIVLGLRLMIGGAELLIGAEEDEVLSYYRNGFLLEKGTIAYSSVDLIGRIALAALIALSGSVILGAIAGSVAMGLNRSFMRSAMITIRYSMILLFLIGLYSALFLPEEKLHLEDVALVVEKRNTFLHLGIPFTSKEGTIEATHISSIEVNDHSLRISDANGSQIASIELSIAEDDPGHEGLLAHLRSKYLP
jgi:hypothetical protein